MEPVKVAPVATKPIVTKPVVNAPVVSTLRNTIAFPDGSRVRFKESINPNQDQAFIDRNTSMATTWYTAPTFSGYDNSNTYFAAHTRAFKYLFAARIGSVVSVYDASGNKFSYKVVKIDEMNDIGDNRKGYTIWEDFMTKDSGSGEYVTFQTCIDDYWNIVVKARLIK